MPAFFYAPFTDVFIVIAEKPFYGHSLHSSFVSANKIKHDKILFYETKMGKKNPFYNTDSCGSDFRI